MYGTVNRILDLIDMKSNYIDIACTMVYLIYCISLFVILIDNQIIVCNMVKLMRLKEKVNYFS